MSQVILALLASLSAPLFLIPIEKFLPYPYLIEELIKLIIVGVIIKAENKTKNFIIWVILAGILFSISESIFYLVNIFANGNLILFPKRLILTGVLHLGTILLLYVSLRKNLFWATVGFSSAILIHYLYNSLIGSF